jgi:hypothetical protein
MPYSWEPTVAPRPYQKPKADTSSPLRDFSEMVGGYWSRDNAEFEKANPSIGRRLVRSFNPMTGLGSALGSMYDAAGSGDLAGMATSTASAVPMFGWAKTGAPTFQSLRAMARPDFRSAQGLKGWKSQLASMAPEWFGSDSNAR